MSKPTMLTNYLGRILNIASLKEIVNKMTNQLQQFVHEFDAIAVRGMSGSLVGPQIAMNLDKQLIIVRKDSSHSQYKVEGGFTSNTRYVILDDFISTGETVKSIIKEIDDTIKHYENCNIHATCVGLAMYKQCPKNILEYAKGIRVAVDFYVGAEIEW
jgi:orotate phosphoribosyltransferase-like protein